MSQLAGSDLAAPAAPQGFDYQVIPVEIRDQVERQTREIRGLMGQAAQDIIAIGQRLIAVKEQLGSGATQSAPSRTGAMSPTGSWFPCVSLKFWLKKSFPVDESCLPHLAPTP